MATLFMRSVLFLCSYFPLIAILCILHYNDWPLWVTLLVGAIGVGSVALTLLYIFWLRRAQASQQTKITTFSSHDADVMGYIASYVIPFVSFSGSWQWYAALGVFIGVLYVIYVHSNMIYINPMLNLCGFRLYEIEIEHSPRPHYYIARKPLERDHQIRFVRLSGDILLEK